MSGQTALTGTAVAAADELLRLEGISVRLSGREILRDVGFAIRPGEFTGLIGPNGAGKTTILRVILGLQAPTSGTVILAGQPHGKTGRSRAGSLVGYVPQKLLIEPDMPLRVRDVVALGIDGNRLGHPLPLPRAPRTGRQHPARGRGRRLRRRPRRRAVRWRAAARPHRARADQPAEAAPAGRAAGQPRHSQCAGHRGRAREAGPGAADRGADLRARHEPAGPGDGPHRLRRRGPGRGRQRG